MANSFIKNPLILFFTSQVSDVADDSRKQSKLLKYLAIIGIGYLQQAKRTQEQQQQGNFTVAAGAALFSFAQIKKLAKANEKSWVSLMRQQLQQLQMQQVREQPQQKYPSKSQDIHEIQSSFMPKYKKQFQENAGGLKDDSNKEKKKGNGTIGEMKCLQLSQSSIHHPSVVSPTSNCPSSCRALALDFLSQNSLQRFEHENIVSHSPASNTPKDVMTSQQKEGGVNIPMMESCIINNMGNINSYIPPKTAILELDERDISEESAMNKRIREQRLTPKHTNFVNSLRRNDSEKYVNQQSRKSSISPKHNNNNNNSNNAANSRTNIAGNSNNNSNSTGSSQIALPAYLRNVQSKIADQVRHHRELSKGRVNSPDNEKNNSLSPPPFRHASNGSQQFQSLNGSNNLGTPIAPAGVAPKTPMNSKNTKNFNFNSNMEIQVDAVDQEHALESLKTCHFRTKSSTSESLLTPTQDLRRKYSQFSQHNSQNNNNNNIASVSKHPFSSTASGSIGSSTAYNTFKDTFSNVQCENSNNNNSNHNSHSSSGFFAGSLQSSQHSKNNVLEIAQHFLTSPLMKQLYPKEYPQQKDLKTQDRLGVTPEILQKKQQMPQYAFNGGNGDRSHLNNNTTKAVLNEGNNSQVFKMNSKAQQYPSQYSSSLKSKELSCQESQKRTNKDEIIDESKFQQQRYQWKMSQSGLFNNDDQIKQSRLPPNDENHNSFSGFKQSITSKPQQQQQQQQQHQSFMSSLSNSNVMSPFHAGEESKIFFRHEFERQIQMKTSSVMGLDASSPHNNNNNNNNSLSNNSQSYYASKNNYNLPQTPADQSDISFNAGDPSASLFPSSRPLFQH